jgi:dynein intermediate chain 1, axonemal
LFVTSYGSFEFTKQIPGLLALFSLKNPSYPELVIPTESGVMSMSVHPQHGHILAAGFQDGSVAVYNLKKKNGEAMVKSHRSIQHRDPVAQLMWQGDDLDEHWVFFSVGGDGRVIQWTVLKNELVATVILFNPGCLKTINIRILF